MKAVLSPLAIALVLAAAGCSDVSGTGTTTSSGGGGQSSANQTSSAGGGGSSSVVSSSSSGGSSSVGGSSKAGSSSVDDSGGSSGGKSTSGGSSVVGGTSSGGRGGSAGASTGGSTSSGVTTGGTGGRGGSASGGTASGGTATGGTVAGGTSSKGGTTSVGGSSGGTSSTSTSTIVGATPPMGWNSWNKFACGSDLNETSIKQIADAFITTGMKDAGYQYVNLDDCWMNGRDSSTRKIKVDSSRFPAGLKSLADYVHDKGLKFGLYSTPNTKTCAGLYGNCAGCVGSKGYETDDANTYAEWGVDYLKYDKCQGDRSAFATMYNAIQATKRPIFISINPADQSDYCTASKCTGLDVTKVSNAWRIEFDINASWASVIKLIDRNKPEYTGAGPGHWNDPDMLEVGNGLNETEGRAHFSMWVIMASPLLSGNDIRKMDTTTKAILTNKEATAINQDPLGKQGRVVATPGSNLEVWSKELAGTNARGVALFNRGSSAASITVKWTDLGLPAGPASVRDIWAAKDSSATDSYTATSVPSHGVVLLKVVSGG
jgi:alpha-galactosidase